MKAKTILAEIRGRSLKVPNKMADASLLCPAPRTSRSLSPVPTTRGATQSSCPPLARSASDRERDFKISVQKSISITICPQLTPSQVVVIRKSWRHINTKAFASVLRRCFQRLESSCPCVASTFSSASNSLSTCPSQVRTLADHAKYLGCLVQRIIESDEGVEEELRHVGAAHVRQAENGGIGTKEFERFGEILVEMILKLDGIQQSKETSRAWRQLLCAMVDGLRDGFDAELRQTRRKSSFGVHSEYFNELETYRRNSSPGSSRKTSLNIEAVENQLSPRKYSNYTC